MSVSASMCQLDSPFLCRACCTQDLIKVKRRHNMADTDYRREVCRLSHPNMEKVPAVTSLPSPQATAGAGNDQPNILET